MKVSVVIPVYNVEDYLRQCLDSVVNQTLGDIEIICVDDGSTDGSPAILAEYAAKDQRIKVIAHERSTAGVVRNVGLSVARGKYVAFFDSDDFIAPDALGELHKLAELNKAEIVVSGVTRYAADGKRVLAEQQFDRCTQGLNPVFAGKDLGDSIFTTFLPAPWNKFYLTEFVRNNNLEFQDLPRCNDLCFTMTAFACAKRIAVLNRTCYCYRQGVGGSLQNTSDKDPLCVCRAYQELMNQLKRRGLYERHAVAYAKAAVSSTLYTFNLFHEMSSVDQLFACLRSSCPEILETKLTKDDFCGNESAFGRYANLLSADGAAELLLRELSFWRNLAVARDGKIRVLQFQNKKRIQELSDEIYELHKSFAYRVGMFATWPARLAYRMLKCCWKSGLKSAPLGSVLMS